tara:strand:- start:7813 stop:8280 length:468 start_codon:yes stop_codon:yes gene_type:complete
MLALILLAQIAVSSTDLPSDYLEASRVIAEDSVISGFCYGIGWEPDPSAEAALETELDQLVTRHGVMPGLARETLLQQALEVSQALRVKLVRTPGDAVQRAAYLDELEDWARENCNAVARRRPALFKGDTAVNQTRVDNNFAEMRRQNEASTARP